MKYNIIDWSFSRAKIYIESKLITKILLFEKALVLAFNTSLITFVNSQNT